MFSETTFRRHSSGKITSTLVPKKKKASLSPLTKLALYGLFIMSQQCAGESNLTCSNYVSPRTPQSLESH